MLSTLSGQATYQEDIRKSRFLAVAAPVTSADEALAFFSHHAVPEATHNCWAFRIGQVYRFNDDGEPSGTAGRPILQAIEGQACDRVAVLVIRWFGGIKLGTGGLVRAYGGVAAQCLRLAAKLPIVDEVRVVCRSSFSDMALVQSRMPLHDVRIETETFTADGVEWVVRLPKHALAAWEETYTNLTRGQGVFTLLNTSS